MSLSVTEAGRKGGIERAKRLTKERRQEIARDAGKALQQKRREQSHKK